MKIDIYLSSHGCCSNGRTISESISQWVNQLAIRSSNHSLTHSLIPTYTHLINQTSKQTNKQSVSQQLKMLTLRLVGKACYWVVRQVVFSGRKGRFPSCNSVANCPKQGLPSTLPTRVKSSKTATSTTKQLTAPLFWSMKLALTRETKWTEGA